MISNQNERSGSHEGTDDRRLADLTSFVNNNDIKVFADQQWRSRDCQGSHSNDPSRRNCSP